MAQASRSAPRDWERDAVPCDSPLTDLNALQMRLGSDVGTWLLVQERDGLEYVVAESLSSRNDDEARQLLLVARYCGSRGRIALFLRENDGDAFAQQRPDLHLRRPVDLWFVRN